MDALTRIRDLLAGGRYRLTQVRQVEADLGAHVRAAWVATVERVIEDPDDTIECVYVELRTEEERRWAQAKLDGLND